jgi:homoserine kinase
MSSESKSCRVKVPASTSNLGSGFDTLGLAVQLYTTVEVARSQTSEIRIDSCAHPDLARTVSEAVEIFFRAVKAKRFGLQLAVSSGVPVARGLGYSATVRVGILAGANELAQAGLTRDQLLNLATELEGHPDNSSPSIFGGFTVSGVADGNVRCLHFPVPDRLKLVTLVPNFRVSTEQARKLMPGSYSKADAAHALNRAALITAAFASGNFGAIKGLFDDRIHQPYRQSLIPMLPSVIAAGEASGAVGGFLSGSGSGIICLALENQERIAKAMQRVLPDSEVMILNVDNSGYIIG